jgi:hypothetical protein
LLAALQQIVNTALRRELAADRSFVVDCMNSPEGEGDGTNGVHNGGTELTKTNGEYMWAGPRTAGCRGSL